MVNCYTVFDKIKITRKTESLQLAGAGFFQPLMLQLSNQMLLGYILKVIEW